MNKIILTLILSIFIFPVINAGGLIKICIDHTPPQFNNSILSLTSDGKEIYLFWNTAVDKPNCSGISHYEIYRGFNEGNLTLINKTLDNFYYDKIQSYGIYEYIIHAYDKVNNRESDVGISNSINILNSKDTQNSISSGGGGKVRYWICINWSECVEGIQSRICHNKYDTSEARVETKSCIPEYSLLSDENINIPEEINKFINDTEIEAKSGSVITGAAIGFLKKPKEKISLIFIILIIIIMIRTKYKFSKNLSSQK
jgi:hypothetical protein